VAELLIRAKTNGSDKRTHWQRGQIVGVRPDGSTYGASEGPPDFYVVRVAGPVHRWEIMLASRDVLGVDPVTGEEDISARPPKILDVDAPAPPDRASARIPKLRRQMLRRPMAQRLDTGEKLILHRKGMPVRRIF